MRILGIRSSGSPARLKETVGFKKSVCERDIHGFDRGDRRKRRCTADQSLVCINSLETIYDSVERSL